MPELYDVLTDGDGFLSDFEKARNESLQARDEAETNAALTSGVDYVTGDLSNISSPSSSEIALVFSGGSGEYYEYDGASWNQIGPTVSEKKYYEVETVSDLRNLSPTSNSVALVNGRNSPNGAGGGFWVTRASDPIGNGDDGSVVVQASNGLYWLRRAVLEGPIDARWFGFDSTGDNTQALQDAINITSQVAPTRVVAPGGQQGQITDTIHLQTDGFTLEPLSGGRIEFECDTSVQGSGVRPIFQAQGSTNTYSTSLDSDITAGDCFFSVLDAALFSKGDVVRLDEVKTSGGYTLGEWTRVVRVDTNNNNVFVSHPFAFDHLQGDVTLKKYTAPKNLRLNGVRLNMNRDDDQGFIIEALGCELIDCEVIGTGQTDTGVHLIGTDGEIVRPVITGVYKPGLGYGAKVSGINQTIRGGLFRDCRHPISNSGREHLSRDLAYVDNHVEGNGITDEDETIDFHALVSGGVIRDNDLNGAGIMVRCSDAEVRGNNINGRISRGIRLFGEVGPLKRVVVKNNKIDARSFTTNSDKFPIYLTGPGSERVKIEGNEIRGSSVREIVTEAETGSVNENLIIRDNEIYESTSDAGMRLRGLGELLRVERNFVDVSGFGVWPNVPDGARFFFRGNILRGSRGLTLSDPGSGNIGIHILNGNTYDVTGVQVKDNATDGTNRIKARHGSTLDEGLIANDVTTHELASRGQSQKQSGGYIQTGIGREPDGVVVSIYSDSGSEKVVPEVVDTFTDGQFQVRFYNIADATENTSTTFTVAWAVW
jgi:DNA-binding cell septation regulator SpoVG